MATELARRRHLVVIPDDIVEAFAKSRHLDRLRAVAEVVIHPTRPADERELGARIRDADIVLSFRPAFTKFTAGALSACTRLRYVCIAGAGVEDVDIAFASAHGIAVGNVVNTKRAIAEHCLALMFDVARQVSAQDRAIRHGEWKGYRGIELEGKTLGIIGLSAIACELIPLARAIGMTVLSWSRNNDPARAREIGAQAAPLEDVLANSDVVSLHVRLLPDLKGFIGRDQLGKMKRGAIFINTARGGLVDEDALIEALRSGHLRGAGLDVFAREPLPAGHPLLALDNVVMTPVSAWNTEESAVRNQQRAVDNVLSFIAGTPVSITNLAALPAASQPKG